MVEKIQGAQHLTEAFFRHETHEEFLHFFQQDNPWFFEVTDSLKLTASLHLKMDGWNYTNVLLGWPIFRGELSVSGRVNLGRFPPKKTVNNTPQKCQEINVEGISTHVH